MTAVRVSLVDVYVLRPSGPASVEVLTLRRSAAGRCPGAWETVHGHIDGQEGPVRAAVRELSEETGLEPLRLYNLSRVETFYRHLTDEVALIPVFGAIVDEVATVVLSDEHDAHEWITPNEAASRYSWPRERRAILDVLDLIGTGSAGAVDDVLAISPSQWR
ncbi:MAG: NUDIX domain-containing protein [Gemmatimonadales bacterium]